MGHEPKETYWVMGLLHFLLTSEETSNFYRSNLVVLTKFQNFNLHSIGIIKYDVKIHTKMPSG